MENKQEVAVDKKEQELPVDAKMNLLAQLEDHDDVDIDDI